MTGVATDPSVLFIQDSQLRVQKLGDSTSQVLASNVRIGCVPYVLAPDGSRVAYQDQKGPGGRSRPMAAPP
ncbi:MAG: hypothetical protein HZY76_10200 [Anaerolineae bacterium]|nr:MAG: hypothetical protein HZY76_10200 [Anaerolineae bacterium]